jgi:polar amino acid transport system substrate-binding protein
VQTGTTYLENVKKVGAIKEVKNFPQDTDARAALASGRVDAWVTDRFVAMNSLKAEPTAGLKMGDFLFIERIASAVAKGNTGLASELNKALAAIQADGTYATISKKYFNEGRPLQVSGMSRHPVHRAPVAALAPLPRC